MSSGRRLQAVLVDEEPAAAAGGGDGRGGGNLGERLARVEAHLEHVATKEDVQTLKTDLVDAIGKKETSMLRWQIGIVVAAAVILIVAALITSGHSTQPPAPPLPVSIPAD